MHPLAEKIASLQHRLIMRRRLIAACWISATVLATALALGLSDYLIRYSDRGLRIMATAALVATVVWACYRWWFVPNRRRLVPLTVAQRVEARFPQLGDALASAVEFLGQDEYALGAGSAQLRRHVITEAQTAIEGLQLDQVIDRRPLRRAAAWLAAAFLVLSAFLVIDAGAVGTAMARLVAPFGATQWPRVNHLEFRNPPSRLAAGQKLELELIDSAGPLPDEVRIEYRTSHDGRRELESERMIRIGDAMMASRDNVEQSFSFRATGGDDDTMLWHDILVVAPPRLDSLDLVIHPPTYTGLPFAKAERHLEVLEGSGIEVHGTSSAPLGAARILLDGDEAVAAVIDADANRPERRAFHVTPDKWIAIKSGTYRVELTGDDGLAGAAGQWNIRVNPDTPPSISWQSPAEDLHVTAAAVVPLELAVKDNLAIQKVDLLIERPTPSANEQKLSPERIELFRGPEKISVRDGAANVDGESRVAEHALDIAALNLPVGTQLTLEGEAADYRPGVGRTVAPRRVTLITPDDLEARLADRQTQIVRQLERALATEQTTREDVRRLEIQQRDAGTLSAGDRNALQSAELNQRRVGRMLVDPTEGVPALVESLLGELEMNRLPANDTRGTLRELSSVLERLATGPLPTAESELTSARKSGEAINEGDNTALVGRSLTSAGGAQDQVIAQLEILLGDLSGWADFRRFARQLAELRTDQIAHEKASRSEIGLDTLPLDVRELNRAQRANLNKASAGQDALARRYEKIEQGMDALARQLADKDATAAATLADAVDLARRLTIGTSMHETSGDLNENRVGVALDREKKISDDLQRVLDLLRNQSAERGQQLVDMLKQSQQRLFELREQLAELREQIEKSEQQGSADARRSQALTQRQTELRRQIEQLARELDRLQADAAGRSTESAANRLNNQQSPNQNDSNQRPSPSNQVQKSERDLEEAARQLAQRVQEAEFDVALAFVQRFQAELQEMITRQEAVIDDTATLDASRQPNARLTMDQAQQLADLSASEGELASLAIEHSEVLHGLSAVEISLRDVARGLNAAAELLGKQDSGASAQQAERHALVRLEGMLEAFDQTAAEAGQKRPGGSQGGQSGQHRRPTFELLEVKMLRMLQVDLNERTQAFRERISNQGGRPADARGQAALAREAQELAAEQRRLAGLVQEMLSRNNKQQGEQDGPDQP